MSRTPDRGLNRADAARLAEVGLDPDDVERQIALLTDPPPPIRLDRPCTIADGIVRLEPDDDERLLTLWQQAAGAGRLSKFVPASGAASRMFDAPSRVRRSGPVSRTQLEERAASGDRAAAEVLSLLQHLDELPFSAALAEAIGLEPTGLGQTASAAEISTVLEALLSDSGLRFGSLAKGLVPFHRYAEEIRTAFEEHLIEGTNYIADSDGRCRHHFTVPEDQRAAFGAAAAALAKRHGFHLDVGLSTQDHATDTVALDSDGELVRHSDGRLHLRPGGHGALLPNLENSGGDVVFIKNIDNVGPEERQAEASLWQKRLSGLLLELQQQARTLQQDLAADGWQNALAAADQFCSQRLAWQPRGDSDGGRRAALLERLDRPLRVCGMVRNEGEPGGGPFWVTDQGGGTSLQIVEAAQVATDDPGQDAIWRASTHFNPVLLVASLRDRSGATYRLSEFVDRSAVFVSEKPVGGQRARVLERPGLWNGAMANWNTVFVEVPLVNFSPVKTVLDLLRPAHSVSQG